MAGRSRTIRRRHLWLNSRTGEVIKIFRRHECRLGGNGVARVDTEPGRFPCGLAHKISEDFHDAIGEACCRCQTGIGGCVIELMFEAVEDFDTKRPEAWRDRAAD